MPPSEMVDDDGVYISKSDAAALHSEPRERSSIDSLLSERRSGSSVPGTNACAWIATNEYQGNRRESFVIVRGVLNAKARLYQIRDAEHTVGVAVKYSGGAWEAGGTRTRNWENETSQGGITGTKKYYNHVRYRKYLYDCGGVKWMSNNEQQALAGYTIPANPLDFNNCSLHGNEYEFTKTQGKNTTYSTGMELSVLDVSAQSGWGSKTKIKWTFTGRAKICWSSSANGLEGSARVITKPA
jgi:hypothetical protein